MSGVGDLDAAVRELADARVRGDLAAFAAHLTPQALLSLHRESISKRRPRDYRLVEVAVEGDTGRSLIEFSGAGRYDLALRWQRSDGGWKATDASIPEASIRPPWWRKLLRLGVRRAGGIERKDLA